VDPATSIPPSTSSISLRTNASSFSATSVAFGPTDFGLRETTHFGCACHAADVIVEMTARCGARGRQCQSPRGVIDVSVEGLHHAENELAHAFSLRMDVRPEIAATSNVPPTNAVKIPNDLKHLRRYC
jgi:hypothetical protein